MNDDGDLTILSEQHDSGDGRRRSAARDSDGIGEDDRRVAVQVTTQSASGLNPTLLLPQAILDTFSASEKEALPRLLEQFITSRVFRSTIIYDLSPESRATVDVDLGIDSGSETSSSASWQPAESSKSSSKRSKSYRFPLMELPAELRIMVAKYVLHVSNGLSWVWTNYRKGLRIATVKVNTDCETNLNLQQISALTQTCKTLYQETQGLVFAVNFMDFCLYNMHDGVVPRRCKDDSDGLDGDLRASSEALDFWYSFASRKQRQNPLQIRLYFYTFEYLQEYWAQFLALTQHREHLKTRVVISGWSLRWLGSFARRSLVLLQEEAEPYESEYEQVEACIQEHIRYGTKIQEAVAGLGVTNKNWRIYPARMSEDDVEGIRSSVSDADWEMIRGWEADGI